MHLWIFCDISKQCELLLIILSLLFSELRSWWIKIGSNASVLLPQYPSKLKSVSLYCFSFISVRISWAVWLFY